MHEYALVEEVLETAEEQLRAQGAVSVATVVLRVGANSGYSVESIRQAYEMLKEGTPAEQAEMVIDVDEGDGVTLERIVLEA